MKVVPFLARSAADAVEQIRAQLGPEAVVLNVRKVPASGLARLWQSPRMEVLACRPDPVPEGLAPPDSARNPCTLDEARFPFHGAHTAAQTADAGADLGASTQAQGQWNGAQLLESIGLLPLYAQHVLEQIKSIHGLTPPGTLSQQLALIRTVLLQWWRPLPAMLNPGPPPPHVFIGPPGTGKTTVLCKWLAQTVLMNDRTARVWRLDGRTANTAESLSVYGDILGVPVERDWPASPMLPTDQLQFIDLPGTDFLDPEALKDLRERLQTFPSPQVHLVLNAAYSAPLLLKQARAFSHLSIHKKRTMSWFDAFSFSGFPGVHGDQPHACGHARHLHGAAWGTECQQHNLQQPGYGDRAILGHCGLLGREEQLPPLFPYRSAGQERGSGARVRSAGQERGSGARVRSAGHQTRQFCMVSIPHNRMLIWVQLLVRLAWCTDDEPD